ncbi:MAG TPA: DUF4231 domain-containing protein [Actinomycetota bacterium]|jgi:hypothetical protein
MRRLALFKRFPSIRWRPKPDWPLVGSEHWPQYPELADDLGILEQELVPTFRKLDREALRLQNSFRRQHLSLILGGALATILGALQAALGGGVAWAGTLEAVLGGGLAGVAVYIRGRRTQRAFLTTRLKAEQLRSEFFLFLACVGAYADPVARVRFLRQRISEVEGAEAST